MGLALSGQLYSHNGAPTGLRPGHLPGNSQDCPPGFRDGHGKPGRLPESYSRPVDRLAVAPRAAPDCGATLRRSRCSRSCRWLWSRILSSSGFFSGISTAQVWDVLTTKGAGDSMRVDPVSVEMAGAVVFAVHRRQPGVCLAGRPEAGAPAAAVWTGNRFSSPSSWNEPPLRRLTCGTTRWCRP